MTQLSPKPGLVFGEEDDELERALDVEAYNEASIYNHYGFKPVRWEASHEPVTIVGRLPDDLEGVYVRNGTNPQFDRSRVRYHMFGGAGMLHQVQISEGRATYSNTYVRTPRFVTEQRFGREVYPEFSDVAGAGSVGARRVALVESKKHRGLIPNLSSFELTPGSTSVQYHHGALYALQESGYAFRMNAQLDNGRLLLDGTGSLERWGGAWRGPLSAHVRIDPASGDLYNLSVEPGGAIIAGHVRQGQLESQAQVHQQPTTSRMGYLHDFFLTEHFLVFPDISIRRDLDGLLGPEGSVFRFDADRPLRWGVLPRRFSAQSEVEWFDTARAGSIWHVVNAWEEVGPDGSPRIVLFAPRFATYPPDMPIHTPREPHSHLTRWTLDLGSGKVVEDRTLLEHGYERPSVNLQRVGHVSRYGYLIDEEREGYMGKGVLKYDLVEDRPLEYFDYGDLFGGEALFVPKASARDEDDGYLLDLLMGPEKAALVILDAKTMQETARLVLPRRVPFGVHACWVAASNIELMAQSTAQLQQEKAGG